MQSNDRHISMISVIAPCYNEVENIPVFIDRVHSVMDEIQQDYELIIVDDASTDHSVQMVRKQLELNQNIKLLSLSRNFGQQAALLAGIHQATGDVLITIDLDLQQPPEVIPELLEKWKAGASIVHAIPEYHQSATWLKKLTSKMFYRFMQFLGGPQVVYKSNDFRLFHRRVADVICRLPEKNIYLRGAFSWMGFSQDTVTYTHQKRLNGQTKYHYSKMLALALRGIASQSIRPLRIGLVIGIGSISVVFALIAYVLYVHLVLHQTVSGWTSIMITLLFFSSIQFSLLGILGEYIGQIFREVKGRPVYVVGGDGHQEQNRNSSSG